MVLDGKVSIQDEDFDAELYTVAIDFLELNGFIQYEVSNFTKPGYECRHNNAYWRYRDYLSFGPSSHSFMNGKRWWNFSSLKHYISEIDRYGYAIANFELITNTTSLDEYIMLAFRSKGLDVKELKQKFGNDWLIKNKDILEKLVAQKLILSKNDFLRLSKRGYAVCDEILSRLL
jgi:oxygen-independent coproporphyrinogen-3 oxidase